MVEKGRWENDEIIISSQVIKDLADIKCNYAALMFYLFVSLRYGSTHFTIETAQKDFNRSRRTIFRYLNKLRKMDMIKKVGQSGLFKKAKYEIVVES